MNHNAKEKVLKLAALHKVVPASLERVYQSDISRLCCTPNADGPLMHLMPSGVTVYHKAGNVKSTDIEEMRKSFPSRIWVPYALFSGFNDFLSVESFGIPNNGYARIMRLIIGEENNGAHGFSYDATNFKEKIPHPRIKGYGVIINAEQEALPRETYIFETTGGVYELESRRWHSSTRESLRESIERIQWKP